MEKNQYGTPQWRLWSIVDWIIKYIIKTNLNYMDNWKSTAVKEWDEWEIRYDL